MEVAFRPHFLRSRLEPIYCSHNSPQLQFLSLAQERPQIGFSVAVAAILRKEQFTSL